MKKIVIIIALIFVPVLAVIPLLKPGYFSMHDVQHPVRLFLLEQAIKQGYVYPRWVADLGFGFGYPLFNFYPPLIYYIALIFKLLGFSIINSLKLMLISGFLLAAFSSYRYCRLMFSRTVSLIGSLFYTYAFYHAVTIYIRGAWAEFYSYSLFPLIVYFLHSLIIDLNWKKVLGLGISFALLLLCHPLIAFPSLIFITAYFLLAFFLSKKFVLVWIRQAAGLVIGLGLSAFFWLPSLIEKKFTLVDNILTRELYNYRLHFVELKQLYFSPWGFGGSTVGTADGISYQIGKYYLFFLAISLVTGLYLWIKKHKQTQFRKIFLVVSFNLALLILAYFMSLSYSQFIWDQIKYLWYIQFPWRFFTFAALYLSVVAVSIFNWWQFLVKDRFIKKIGYLILSGLVLFMIIKYSQLFRPQFTYELNDWQLTNKYQRQWVISRTSFEFVPKNVLTTKNKLGLTTLAIKKTELPKRSFKIISGQVEIKTKINKFQEKVYHVNVSTPAVFQLNTYYFPGWLAFLDQKPLIINDQNELKLIRVTLPKGNYQLRFIFKNTLVRQVANYISVLSLIGVMISMAIDQAKRQQRHS